jgi:hypothetical protein
MTIPPSTSTASLIRPAGLLLAAGLAVTGCHLVDQRDFDAKAGYPPVLPAVAARPVAGPQALLRISYDTPDPEYAPALSAAVRRALAVKPDVLFTVQTLVPLSPTPDAQAAALTAAAGTGREIADAIVANGADQGQIEMAVKADAAVHDKEVRVFVH